MKLNLARLNHILIPTTKRDRDRFRASAFGKLLRPAGALYGALSDEGRILAVASVVVGAFALDVQSTAVYLLWSALTGSLVASLLAAPFQRPTGLFVDVEAPLRVTAGAPVSFAVIVRNEGERARRAVRVHGPFLPWDGRWRGDRPLDSAIAAHQARRFELLASFSARGEHHLDSFYATSLVPLGLAQGAAAGSSGVRFVVVPRVARVVSLALPISHASLGSATSRARDADGSSFRAVRPYRAGDPVRRIHARTSARRGEVVVREEEDDPPPRVSVVLDPSAPDGAPALEASLSLAAGVVAHLLRREIVVEALVVGDRLHSLAKGSALVASLELLARVEGGRRCDAPKLAQLIARGRSRPDLVVVVGGDADPELALALDGADVASLFLVVGAARAEPRGPRDARVVAVAADAIERGDPLVLG